MSDDQGQVPEQPAVRKPRTRAFGPRRVRIDGLTPGNRVRRDAFNGTVLGPVPVDRKPTTAALTRQRDKIIREAEANGQMVDLTLLPRLPQRPTALPLPLAEDREPWERQPKEAPKAYASFIVYRDLGPMDRSIRRAAKELGVTRLVPSRMFAQWRWEERAAAWDAERQRVFDETRKEQQETAIRSHANVSRALLTQVVRLLQIQQVKDAPDSRVMRDAALSLDKAIHHHRLALGLPTEVSRQDQYLKGIIEEMTANQREIMALLEEVICDDCRAALRGKIVEIKRKTATGARRIAT